MNRKHQDCSRCDVLQAVIGRMERIERAEHQDMSTPLAEAENAIATMQSEAKAAALALKQLVYDFIVERSAGDIPIGRSILLERRREQGNAE